jgi:hypothetical protein
MIAVLKFEPDAPVAQRIEYWPPKPRVVGSNPAGRAKYQRNKAGFRRPYFLLQDFSRSPLPDREIISKCKRTLCRFSVWLPTFNGTIVATKFAEYRYSPNWGVGIMARGRKRIEWADSVHATFSYSAPLWGALSRSVLAIQAVRSIEKRPLVTIPVRLSQIGLQTCITCCCNH